MSGRFDCWLEDDCDRRWVNEFSGFDSSYAAETFAEYAHSNMDMWEAGTSWPVYLIPHGQHGPAERFMIEVEFDPTFSASKPEMWKRLRKERG